MRAGATILSLSGIYEHESFYLSDKSSRFVDLRDITGTNCYCDEDAAKEILQRLGDDPSGIHFIDSGNYHYMSALFLRQISEPFSLIVLDHHPDMQRPMFDILSCGGWVADVLENNEYVRDVHIIGADRKLIDELEDTVRDKAHFYDIYDGELPNTDYPVYLSIDKDVISDDELRTNWDQGEASMDYVISFAKDLLTSGRKVLAVDICGECAIDQEGIDCGREIRINDSFNRRILEAINSCILR